MYYRHDLPILMTFGPEKGKGLTHMLHDTYEQSAILLVTLKTATLTEVTINSMQLLRYIHVHHTCKKRSV